MVRAAPPAPPPPEEYDVLIRYRIDAFRNERVPQFREMVRYLESVGFKKAAPGEDEEDEAENPSVTLMRGTLVSGGDREKVLASLLRERHVQLVRLVPRGVMVPADRPVRVELRFGSALETGRRRASLDEARMLLRGLGFVEGVGYDHRDHTRLVGSLPGQSVELLAREELRPIDLRLPEAANPEAQRALADNARAALKGLGFLETQGYDNRGQTRLVGSVPARSLGRLREGVRLLDLQLPARRDAAAQRTLFEVVRSNLDKRGFVDGQGYDNRGGTHFLGTLPADGADGLEKAIQRRVGDDTLTLDVRTAPLGGDLLASSAGALPLRSIEVLPNLPPPPPEPPQPAAPAKQEKIGPRLRRLIGNKETASRPYRMEVILALTPEPQDTAWRRRLVEAGPNVVIEGRLGPLVTVVARPEDVAALAALASVSAVRLPIPAQPELRPVPGEKGDALQVLRASGVERLHTLGHKGTGTRVAVIDADFQGWQYQRQIGNLPPRTICLDLTALRNRDLYPDPFSGTWAETRALLPYLPQPGMMPVPMPPLFPVELADLKALTAQGHGTRVARATALAAPGADLVLIRIDPACPYMLEEAARFLNGEVIRSESLAQRFTDLDADRQALERRREPLLEERKQLLASELPFEDFQEKWAAYRKRQEAFDRDEREYNARLHRFLQCQDDLRSLGRVRVVANSLVWNEGYPADGGSALSRYFDDRPFRSALWFQAAGSARGQAWNGLFRDVDGNGVMEFAPLTPSPLPPGGRGEGVRGTKLPEGRWTNELNFLGWRSAGKEAAELPAGARLRLSLQWREAHDPEFLRHGEDLYRQPLARLKIVLLRQRDPSGKKLPADDLEVVAQSERLPLRLQNEPASAVYEHTLDYIVTEPGRYLVRIEGEAPKSLRPPSEVTLPVQRTTVGELRPRLFVETLGAPGRAVLLDFTSDRPAVGGLGTREGGSLGIPADSRVVVTVGAAGPDGKREPFGSGGPPMNLELLTKPDVLAYDGPGFDGPDSTRGTSMAAGFAAGMAASAFSAGTPVPHVKFMQTIQARPGRLLKVPRDWPARGK